MGGELWLSAYIQAEAELAVQSFLLGILLMVSYDCLRIFRLLMKHGSLWTGLEDFIYWIYAASMTFSLLFRENSGILRGYVIVGVFLGMFLYDRLVSQSVFKLLKKIGRWIKMKIKNRKKRKEERNHEQKP